MSPEVVVAIAVAFGGLIMSCVSIGVAIGRLREKVDTTQKDMNSAFKMIRELQLKQERK